MKDGFLKAAALSPALRVADCAYNTRQILTELRAAAARGVKLAVFPEFCLTGYTCGDLFLQRTLQQGALTGLQELLDASRELDTVALVGLPLMVRGKLYNCAAVLCRGQLLGLVPKTYLPNYGEFYEKRQFTPGSTEVEWVNVCGQDVPFGTSLLFRCRQMPSFALGVELCEDLWSALPPSTFHALAGATVIGATLQTTQTTASVYDASIAEIEIRLAKLEKDCQRYQNLVKRNAATPIQLEQIETEYEATHKKLEAVKRQQKAALSGVNEVSHRRENTEAAIQRATAALEMAKLNLSYTVVTAPCDGKLGRRTLEEGQFITAGQTVTYILPDTQKWIIANYKETQIENLRLGQEVIVTVDAISDKEFTGKITAISGATGSKYSLVPTDNSAGNFVKIQQRIPVRIDFTNLSKEDNERLAAGMMVVVKVKI